MKLRTSIWTDDCEAIIPFRDQAYSVKFDIIYDELGCPEKCNLLEFLPAKDQISKSKGDYVQWGGWPKFRQESVKPYSDDGRPYDFLCMVDNGWGDSGTCNIFVLVKQGQIGYEVEDLFMEYSCC
jgi:hypothetical protein